MARRTWKVKVFTDPRVKENLGDLSVGGSQYQNGRWLNEVQPKFIVCGPVARFVNLEVLSNRREFLYELSMN